MPALFTSRSRPPSAFTASPKPRSTSSSRETSIWTVVALPPAASIASAIARAVESSPTWLMATAAP